MKASCAVAPDLWLGVARPCAPGPVKALWRYRLDRKASEMAQREAVAASGRRAEELMVSRTHTCGVGAALVGPAPMRLGVDLVRAAHVRERHLDGIVTGRESGALRRYGRVGPALAWGLKEAAAKASGDPRRCFPFGLRIEQGPSGLVVRNLSEGGACYGTGWLFVGALLCVWVREVRLLDHQILPQGPGRAEARQRVLRHPGSDHHLTTGATAWHVADDPGRHSVVLQLPYCARNRA